MASEKVKGTSNLNPDEISKKPMPGLDDGTIDTTTPDDDALDDNAAGSTWLDEDKKGSGEPRR